MKVKYIILVFFGIILGVGIAAVVWFKSSPFAFLPEVLGFNKPMTYLILLQNNYEIRPTGGYIGSFAIITVENAKITNLDIFDTNEFDRVSQRGFKPPSPLKEFLHVDNWQLRDVNWSPDFPTTAKQAVKFYNLESAKDMDFDGVAAVNASILPTIINFIGPVQIEENEFNEENVILALEYEVELGFKEKGIGYEGRKGVLVKLVKEVSSGIENLSLKEKIRLSEQLRNHADNKDMLLYSKNPDIQLALKEKGWTGELKPSKGDYLMVVDTNLGAFKSDFFIERSLDYTVDLTDMEKPKAKLVITYDHNAKESNWLTKDYRSYVRVYTPKGSWMTKTGGVKDKTDFSAEKNYTVLANFAEVPLDTKKQVIYEYNLPKNILAGSTYELLVQKQPGLEKLPVKVTLLTGKSSKQIIFEKEILKDHKFVVNIDTAVQR